MRKLYVIENESKQRENLLNLLEENKNMQSIAVTLEHDINTSEELMADIKINNESHIYFLDIDLGGRLDGIQLASKVREIDPKGIIIFVTAVRDRLFETVNLAIEPLAYLIKSNFDKVELQAKIDEIAELLRVRYEKDESLTIEVQGSIHKIQFDNIYFIETMPQSKKTIFHLKDDMLTVNMTIKALKEKLVYTNFLLELQSYIINPAKINQIDSKEGVVSFLNNDIIYAGRRTITKVKQLLALQEKE
ncbi:response regulator transcription factor [Listeria grandensis]|uniref:Response regulator transcription factor n=1 Tax=Listeria grandensis TaxID=1494963 RepID=A0A7X1CPD6_9LIST|nr:LytTR family DNA-binding domain-containing protein [Listeria grandensis]MBC1935846.1 response regulator transcription factor [Listeria grandensis]